MRQTNFKRSGKVMESNKILSFQKCIYIFTTYIKLQNIYWVEILSRKYSFMFLITNNFDNSLLITCIH